VKKSEKEHFDTEGESIETCNFSRNFQAVLISLAYFGFLGSNSFKKHNVHKYTLTSKIGLYSSNQLNIKSLTNLIKHTYSYGSKKIIVN
jgi:hypothetical protein